MEARAELGDKGFLKFTKESYFMNRLSIIGASGLELEAPDDAMLTALRPDIEQQCSSQMQCCPVMTCCNRILQWK